MPQTRNGYDPFLVTSALQKAIRRGQEQLAIHWAVELDESGWTGAMLNRLRTIAYEDVGIGDMMATMFAQQAIDVAISEKPFGRQKLAYVNAILAMCRAKKSRIADHAIFDGIRMMRLGPKPQIPDEAHDKHTYSGIAKGRGFVHFLQEDKCLTPMSDIPDQFEEGYEAELRELDTVPKWAYNKPWIPYGSQFRTAPPTKEDAPPKDLLSGDDRAIDDLLSEMPPHSAWHTNAGKKR